MWFIIDMVNVLCDYPTDSMYFTMFQFRSMQRRVRRVGEGAGGEIRKRFGRYFCSSSASSSFLLFFSSFFFFGGGIKIYCRECSLVWCHYTPTWIEAISGTRARKKSAMIPTPPPPLPQDFQGWRDQEMDSCVPPNNEQVPCVYGSMRLVIH